jgi:hypothetical protein
LARALAEAYVRPALRRWLKVRSAGAAAGADRRARDVLEQLFCVLTIAPLSIWGWWVLLNHNGDCTPLAPRGCLIGWPALPVTPQFRWWWLSMGGMYVGEMASAALGVGASLSTEMVVHHVITLALMVRRRRRARGARVPGLLFGAYIPGKLQAPILGAAHSHCLRSSRPPCVDTPPSPLITNPQPIQIQSNPNSCLATLAGSTATARWPRRSSTRPTPSCTWPRCVAAGLHSLLRVAAAVLCGCAVVLPAPNKNLSDKKHSEKQPTSPPPPLHLQQQKQQLVHASGLPGADAAKNALFKAFAAVFLVVRVVLPPFSMLMPGIVYGWQVLPLPTFCITNGLMLAIYSLQLIWFTKILKIAAGGSDKRVGTYTPTPAGTPLALSPRPSKQE